MRIVKNFLFKSTWNQSESNIYFAEYIFLTPWAAALISEKNIYINEWLKKKTLLNAYNWEYFHIKKQTQHR